AGLRGAGILAGSGAEVRVAAPALPVAWPRLRAWLAEERPGLADHGRLRDAALAWAAHGRKDADLHQGSALERDNRWAGQARRNIRLNATERDFLAASAALAGRRRRLRRLLTVALTVLLAATAVLGTLAETQRRTVTAQRDAAIARRLAAWVPELRAHVPTTALLLSVAAWRVSPVPEARLGLLASLGQADVSTGLDGRYVSLPDYGHVLLSDGEGDGATVLDPASGAVTGRIRSPVCCTNRFLSPDASLLVDIDAAQLTTRVFDARGGRLLHEAAIVGNGVVFDARGDRAAIFTYASARPVTIVDLPGGAPVRSLSRKRTVALALSPDGSTLALSNAGRRVELVDLASGRTERTIDVPLPAGEQDRTNDEVHTLAFTADGETLVTHDGDLRFWAVDTGAERVDHPGNGRHVVRFALDASGRWLATAESSYAVHLQDLRSGWTATVVSGLPSLPEELAFTRDGRGLSYWLRTGGVRFADLSSYTAPKRLAGEVTYAAFAPAAGRAATYGPDGVRVWDLATLRRTGPATALTGAAEETSPCAQYADPVFQPVDLSPDGTRIAVIVPDGSVRIADVATGREVARLQERPPRRAGDLWRVRGVTFGPGGDTLAVVTEYAKAGSCDDEHAVQLWTAAPRWRLAHVVQGARGQVAFLPGGRELVTVGDSDLLLVDLASGKTVQHADIGSMGIPISVTGLAPDARHVLVGGDPVYQADPRTGRVLQPPLATGDGLSSAASSPDGRTLATVDREHRVRLHDTVTGQAADLPLPGASGPVRALAFSADGRTLHALTADGTLFSHVTDPERAAALVCAHAGGRLSSADWARYLPELPYRDIC
ncbi:MAG: hypothetical protein HOV97_25205, partial [Nonomuraea sp.]|nr:hypothetical protein [Nonomuraea sp.]